MMSSSCAGRLLAAVVCAWLSVVGSAAADAAVEKPSSKPVAMFVGAHPDDSEGFMGLALLMREKYTVQFVDFTRGEGGCGEAGFLDGTTAAKRVAEERDVCRAFGTVPRFLSQTNYCGLAHADARAAAELVALLDEFKPVAVFTHWPVDDHEDHVQCAATVLHALRDAARAGRPRPELYFFEVAVWQTKNYRPTYYVDVSSVMGEVSSQIGKYVSQDGVKLDANKRARMRMRGAQAVPRMEYAETFTTFDGKPIAGGVLETLKETVRRRSGLTPEEAGDMALSRTVDRGWAVCMETLWSPKTSLVYTCPPDEVRPASGFGDGPGYFRFTPGVEGRNTYGEGMEDCALICGVALSGLCDRWMVAPDSATAATAASLARGVMNLATLHGYRGFVARGICVEDGRSVCSLSSRDQYTHWLHGLFCYCESGMAGAAFRAEFAQAVADVARYMEARCTPERNWNFGMVDGSPDPRGICTMWGPDLHPHEHARLPMIYLVAWKATGDGHWRDLYEAIADEAIDKSVNGMGDPGETGKMPCYSLLQANSSFEVLLAVETDAVRRGKLLAAMEKTASVARSRALSELADHKRRFYGMCDDGELALTQLMSPRTPVSDDVRRFLRLVVGREDLTRPDSCRAAHVLAAYWRFRTRVVLSEAEDFR